MFKTKVEEVCAAQCKACTMKLYYGRTLKVMHDRYASCASARKDVYTGDGRLRIGTDSTLYRRPDFAGNAARDATCTL